MTETKDLIVKATHESENILASLLFIKHSAAYKTRQHIRLSDKEIEDLLLQIEKDFTRVLLVSTVAAELCIRHNLDTEFDALYADVLAGVSKGLQSSRKSEVSG